MKSLVIIVILFILPICFAKEVNIPETFTSDNIQITSYFYAGNNLVATKENNEVKYYSSDRIGSNRLTTDDSGLKVGETKTLPFGEEVLNTVNNKFTFTGKELDSELYYFGARYYDSNLGRFTSVDPVAENHDYNYVDNNPMNYKDVNGLDKYKVLSVQVNIDENLETRFNRPATHAVSSSNGKLLETNIPSQANIIMISGHHHTGETYLFSRNSLGQNNGRFAYASLPNTNAEVITFSSCHTVLNPEDNLNAQIELGILVRKNPNLKIVLGYESRSAVTDSTLSSELGKVISSYLEKGDYIGLAEYWIGQSKTLNEEGVKFDYNKQKDIKNQEGGIRGLTVYVKVGGSWYFLSSEVAYLIDLPNSKLIDNTMNENLKKQKDFANIVREYNIRGSRSPNSNWR